MALEDPTSPIDAAWLEPLGEMVRADTGWTLDLAKIDIETVNRETFLAAALDDLRCGSRLDEASWSRATGPRGLVEHVREGLRAVALKRLALAAYLPFRGAVLIVGPNAASATPDRLRAALFHELVHVAQHQRHPDYLAAMASTLDDARQAKLDHGRRSAEHLDLEDSGRARKVWLEAQARYLERERRAVDFPGYEEKLGTVGFLCAWAWEKLTDSSLLEQHRGADAAFAHLATSASEMIEAVFANPKLVELMLKTRG